MQTPPESYKNKGKAERTIFFIVLRKNKKSITFFVNNLINSFEFIPLIGRTSKRKQLYLPFGLL